MATSRNTTNSIAAFDVERATVGEIASASRSIWAIVDLALAQSANKPDRVKDFLFGVADALSAEAERMSVELVGRKPGPLARGEHFWALMQLSERTGEGLTEAAAMAALLAAPMGEAA